MYSLVGVNGNAFSIMGYVTDAMKKTGFSKEDIDDYREHAISGDYDHLVAVSMDLIDQVNERCKSTDVLDDYEEELESDEDGFEYEYNDEDDDGFEHEYN